MAPGGVGGAHVHEGNIGSVFLDKTRAKQAGIDIDGRSIMLSAMSAGGNRLDAFASQHLVDLYTDHGFVPVAWMDFNDEIGKQEGWNFELGRPPVVFFAHNGDSLDTVVRTQYPVKTVDQWLEGVTKIDDYDAGVTYQKDYLKGVEGSVDRAQEWYEDRTKARSERLARSLEQAHGRVPGLPQGEHGIRSWARSGQALGLRAARHFSRVWHIESEAIDLPAQWNTFNAVYFDEHIFLNGDYENALAWTLTHEATHDLVNVVPILYKHLVHGMERHIKDHLANVINDFSERDWLEVTAEYMGELAYNPETRDKFWDNLEGVIPKNDLAQLRELAKIPGTKDSTSSREFFKNTEELDAIFMDVFQKYTTEARERKAYYPDENIINNKVPDNPDNLYNLIDEQLSSDELFSSKIRYETVNYDGTVNVHYRGTNLTIL